MIFTTSREGSSLVATWEPGHGRFALIVDGRVAMSAKHLRTNEVAQYAWSQRVLDDLPSRVRGLAHDLASMLVVIVGDGGCASARDSMVLPELGGWRCSSCGAPMIIARTPSSVQTLECPLCVERRATIERRSVALAIALVEDRITQAITKEPAITPQTQATAELRKLSRHLSATGDGTDTGDASRP